MCLKRAFPRCPWGPFSLKRLSLPSWRKALGPTLPWQPGPVQLRPSRGRRWVASRVPLGSVWPGLRELDRWTKRQWSSGTPKPSVHVWVHGCLLKGHWWRLQHALPASSEQSGGGAQEEAEVFRCLWSDSGGGFRRGFEEECLGRGTSQRPRAWARPWEPSARQPSARIARRKESKPKR